MKIGLSLVTSEDYFMTKGTLSPAFWASKEDHENFLKLKQQAQAIVMGSNTFEASEEMIFQAAQKAENERVVMTHHPDKYKKFWIANRLTFLNLTPKEFVKQYQKYDQVLLVAGEKLSRAFFNEQLINRVYWTIEPGKFGEGIKFVPQSIPAKLVEIEMKELNGLGTKLYTYEVQYPNENPVH